MEIEVETWMGDREMGTWFGMRIGVEAETGRWGGGWRLEWRYEDEDGDGWD